MLDWSSASDLPLAILLNKADKLKFGAQKNALLAAQKQIANRPLVSVQLFSATRGLGTDLCLDTIRAWLSAPRPS